MCDSFAVSEPPASGGIGSNGEVSGEVDQVRALREEVVVAVHLHQFQGFIGTLLMFCSFRMASGFEFSECESGYAVAGLQLRIRDLFL